MNLLNNYIRYRTILAEKKEASGYFVGKIPTCGYN